MEHIHPSHPMGTSYARPFCPEEFSQEARGTRRDRNREESGTVKVLSPLYCLSSKGRWSLLPG
jgi:hypothetical protein